MQGGALTGNWPLQNSADIFCLAVTVPNIRIFQTFFRAIYIFVRVVIKDPNTF